jgi:hypothetical protein
MKNILLIEVIGVINELIKIVIWGQSPNPIGRLSCLKKTHLLTK